MRSHIACVLVLAGLVLGGARYASATVMPVQDEKDAINQFKGLTKNNLANMKSFLKDKLSILKDALKSRAAEAKAGTDPFTVVSDAADDVATALQDLSFSFSAHAGFVDNDGSFLIKDLDTLTSGARNFFPGVRHGEGGDLDKFVAGANKELAKFMATIRKELAKLRKAVIKNDGSTSDLTFISTVHEFPRSFDPTPSNESSGALNGDFLDAFLVGIALIHNPNPGTPRQDVFVIALSSGDGTNGQIDVRYRLGDSGPTLLTTHNNINENGSGIFQDSLTNENTAAPIFADGFESGDTSAWSNTVP